MELFIFVIGVVLVVGFVCVLCHTVYSSGERYAKGKAKQFFDLPVGRQYRVLCDEELHKANAYVIWDDEEVLLVASPVTLHDTFVVGQTKEGKIVPNHCST